MHYVMENIGQVRASLMANKGEEFKQKDVMSELGDGWKSLSEEAKAPFVAKAEKSKANYDIEIEVSCLRQFFFFPFCSHGMRMPAPPLLPLQASRGTHALLVFEFCFTPRTMLPNAHMRATTNRISCTPTRFIASSVISCNHL